MIVQCKCDCGTEFEEFDNRGRKRKFIYGHQNRGINHPMFGKSGLRKGVKLTDETKKLISINHADFKGEKHPMFGKIHSDATKQLMSELKKGEKHPQYGTHRSDATKKLISIANIGKTLSPETRQLMSENHADFKGEKSPNWRGGLSKLPYCPIWTKWLKEEIKERDNHHCQNPDCKSINLLGVHHIDYDKKNCSANNLITLCRSCNSKANTNREYWKEFYSDILGAK